MTATRTTARDMFTLLTVGGGWKIIGQVFHRHP
jgi:hypothetical protein